MVESKARNSRELTNDETKRIDISAAINDEPSNTDSNLAEIYEKSTDQISIAAPNQENYKPVFSSRLSEQFETPNNV